MSIRLQVVIISYTDSLPCADILKNIKADLGLKDLGENISRIRRNQKGNPMLELKSQVKNLLGEIATERAQNQANRHIVGSGKSPEFKKVQFREKMRFS